jgi:hypothetical protein
MAKFRLSDSIFKRLQIVLFLRTNPKQHILTLGFDETFSLKKDGLDLV